MTELSSATLRLATVDDYAGLALLMKTCISANYDALLSPEQVQASFELMGVDTTLIEDQTFFVAEFERRIVACGGWSQRATLFGGNHTGGRNARLLDPNTEAARIRAMYTDPQFLRKGMASKILKLSNDAAAAAGFKKLELMSTAAGESLYQAQGFQVDERLLVATSGGVGVPLIRMSRQIVREA